MTTPSYVVSLGFDWNAQVNSTIQARPLEIYLVASNGNGDNGHLATFQELDTGRPLNFHVHDITAAAQQTPREEAYEKDVASYRPRSAAITFGQYESDDAQQSASPLEVSGVAVDQAPGDSEGPEPFETTFDGVWVAHSTPFPRFPVYTWKLQPNVGQIENQGRFDMVIELMVERAADGEMRKFYVDPELVVGPHNGGGP